VKEKIVKFFDEEKNKYLEMSKDELIREYEIISRILYLNYDISSYYYELKGRLIKFEVECILNKIEELKNK
jgi:hypothetical protein